MFKLSLYNKFITTYLVYFGVSVLFPLTANALPQDGSIRSGDVQLNQVNAKRLDVNQSSEKAIVDWQSFNIAGDEHTHFQLPSNNSINLSRVIGGQRSDIFGKLSSNGQLMLINPNGVVFGQNSRIDVHGLVATTNDIHNQDFLANRFHFNIPGNPSGMIINRGTINIGKAGLLAFVAPGVENSGIINARLGRVGLASSNQFTLDLYGDNLISLGIDGKILEKVYGPDGKPISSLIDQSGTIYADGGQVYLQTNAARSIVDHAINVSGIIEAKTAEKKRGEIILNGNKEGRVKVAGVLDVSGLNSDQTGGTAHVLGEQILLEKARIFASGFNGGGTVLVGGDYQGKGSVLNAKNTYFDVDSQIFADATHNGNGGRVILWADERTDALGRIYARGGSIGGNGGFVETSGKQRLLVTQAADVSAPFGKPGEWLLDPYDIEIVDSLSNAALTGGNKVDVAIINAALNNGTSVTIKSNNNGPGEGNILLTSAINKTSGTAATLTLDAAGGITINNTVTSTSGALTLALIAATGVVINNDLTLNGGTVTLNSAETFSRTNFENPGRQNIVQISHLSGAALPAAAHVSGTPGGLVHLSGNQNTTNTSAGHNSTITLSGGTVATGGGSATFQDGVTLTSNSIVTSSNGAITFNGTVNGAQSLSLTAGTGDVTFNGIIGGSTSLTSLNISSSGFTTFNADSNFSGTVNVGSEGGITVNGIFTSNDGTLNGDSDTNGIGIFSLGSSGSLANSSNLSITASDFDFQGSHTGSTLDLFWVSLGNTMGIGDAIGDSRIDNDELGRLGNFQLTDTNAFFRTNTGTILIDNAQKLNNEVDFRANSITFANGASAFNQLTLRGENVNFSTNVTATGLIVGDQITNLNFLGNSSLTTSFIGSGGGTGASMEITGTTLNMSSGSTLDSGPGKMDLNFSKGMTVGLLKTTNSSDNAITLTAGTSGIRDADTDGSQDISSPNGTLVVSAEGGFGTFENPMEFDSRALDILLSQDFSSPLVLANRNFSQSFGQSLTTVTTARTFRSSSDTYSLVSYSPVFNTSVSPIGAISGYVPALKPLVANVFSQSFSLLKPTATSTNNLQLGNLFDLNMLDNNNLDKGLYSQVNLDKNFEIEATFADGIYTNSETLFQAASVTTNYENTSNTQFGNLFALDALNKSSLSTGIFPQGINKNKLETQEPSTKFSNLGLESLAQTITVSQIIQPNTIIENTQFRSFGLGNNLFESRIPIGSQSLGTIRTIGGGIATYLLSSSGSVRAVNVLVDSNGGVNNQNNFSNVGLNFSTSNQNRNDQINSGKVTGNFPSSSYNNTSARMGIPANNTPALKNNESSANIQDLNNQMVEMRKRLAPRSDDEEQNTLSTQDSQQPLQKRMNDLHNRVVGEKINSNYISKE